MVVDPSDGKLQWDGFFFFPLAPFSANVSGSDCFTGQSPGTRGTRRAKVQGPCECLRRWGQSTGRRWVCRGFRQDLVPVGMIGFNVVKIWCGFAEKGGCEGVMAACVRVAVQRAVRAAATLGWRMAGAWRALARAKLLMKAAASSLHVPPTSVPSTTKRQRWLLKSLGYVFFSLCGHSGLCGPSRRPA